MFDAAAYYDALGDTEWDRLTATVAGRVSFEVHRRLLGEYLRPGWRVLEVGAGPGRFTRVLADLGATVVVSDISPVQLRLNADHLTGTPAEAAVEARVLLDVADTARYPAGEFDAVVAYGGPLSYVFDGRAADALAGLLRITRPGQPVLASVMSLLGTWRHSLPAVVAGADVFGEDVNDRVLATGDLRVTSGAHACQLYRAREVTDLVATVGAELLAVSASNWASLDHPDTVAALEADPDRWNRFLTHEAAACREPGALDGGTHILFAASSPVPITDGKGEELCTAVVCPPS